MRTWRLLPVLPLPFPATEEAGCRRCAGEAKKPFEKDELGATKHARWLRELGMPALLQTGDTSSSSDFCIAWAWAAPGKQSLLTDVPGSLRGESDISCA